MIKILGLGLYEQNARLLLEPRHSEVKSRQTSLRFQIGQAFIQLNYNTAFFWGNGLAPCLFTTFHSLIKTP